MVNLSNCGSVLARGIYNKYYGYYQNYLIIVYYWDDRQPVERDSTGGYMPYEHN